MNESGLGRKKMKISHFVLYSFPSNVNRFIDSEASGIETTYRYFLFGTGKLLKSKRNRYYNVAQSITTSKGLPTAFLRESSRLRREKVSTVPTR